MVCSEVRSRAPHISAGPCDWPFLFSSSYIICALDKRQLSVTVLHLLSSKVPSLFARLFTFRYHNLLQLLTRHYLINATIPASYRYRYRVHVITKNTKPGGGVQRGYKITGYDPIVHIATSSVFPTTSALPFHAPLAGTWKVAP